MDHHQTVNSGPSINQHESPSNSLLLQLPFDIRHRIYHAVGLGPGRRIDMNNYSILRNRSALRDSGLQENLEQHRSDKIESEDIGKIGEVECSLPPLPLQLLYVCRFMHDEVEKLLYSENRFFITRRNTGGLESLLSLSLAAIRHLSHLTIRVNIAYCQGHCCNDRGRGPEYETFCPSLFKHMFDTPLSNGSDEERHTISQWQKICIRLASTLPNQLALYVICDCHDLETAEMIVESLSSLPKLRDCALRLATDRHSQLHHLAKKTVYSLTGQLQPRSAPFRFLDLPKEIQLRILSYTNLVSGEFSEWGNNFAKYIGNRFFRSTWGTCAESLDSFTQQGYGGLGTPLPHCFCSQGHSAFWFQYRCEDDHSRYFLVSRYFKDVAELVYYDTSRFLISSDGLVPLYLDTTSTEWQEKGSVAVLPFLSWFKNDSFNRIKFLQLHFDRLEENEGLLSEAGWKQWLNTVAVLGKHPRLSNLTIEIRMDEPFWFNEQEIGKMWPPLDHEEMQASHEHRMSSMYLKLFTPMKVLAGLKDLFIHFHFASSDGYREDDGRREQQRILECLVMGEDYDAWKCGKGVHLRYAWEPWGYPPVEEMDETDNE